MLISTVTTRLPDLILSKLRFLKVPTLILRLVKRSRICMSFFAPLLSKSTLGAVFFSPEFRLASARSASLDEDVASVSGTPFTDSGSPKVSLFFFLFVLSVQLLVSVGVILFFFVCSILGYLRSLLMNLLLTGIMKDL